MNELCNVKSSNFAPCTSSNIPKKIHYCWFGKKPLPELALKCINSWKNFLPDYEIVEWNENNYDIQKIPYINQAYEMKKYAFVSDYARFDILYKYGGIYFDTDVEVIKPFDDIIIDGSFMGLEKDISDGLSVASGLGIAAVPGLEIYNDILKKYCEINFINEDKTLNMTTVVTYVTDVFVNHGLKSVSGIQHINGVNIYPKEYFSPKDVLTKKLVITDNTYSIHHYDASWAEWYDRKAGERGPKLKRIFGNFIGGKLNIMIYLIQKYGFIGCVKKIRGRI